MTSPNSTPTAASVGLAPLTAGAYVDAQAAITEHLLALVLRLFRRDGIPLTPQAKQQMAQRLFTDVQYARGLSYNLAVRSMAASAHDAGETLPNVTPIDRYTTRALVAVLEDATAPIDKAIAAAEERPAVTSAVSILDRRTGLPMLPDDRQPSNPAVVVRVARNAGAAVARHAHAAGRDAVASTAGGAGETVGWARVTTSPKPCAFCAMLASRGPVYRSERMALYRGFSMDAYHNHCDCRAVLVFRGKSWDGQADYERLSDLWTASTARKSGKAAVAAFAVALNAA